MRDSKLRGFPSLHDASGQESDDAWDPTKPPKPPKKRPVACTKQKEPAKRPRTKLNAALEHVVLTDSVNRRVQEQSREGSTAAIVNRQSPDKNIVKLRKDLEGKAAAFARLEDKYRLSKSGMHGQSANGLPEDTVASVTRRFCEALRDRTSEVAAAATRRLEPIDPSDIDSSDSDEDDRIGELEEEVEDLKSDVRRRISEYDGLRARYLAMREKYVNEHFANESYKEEITRLTARIQLWARITVVGAFRRTLSERNIGSVAAEARAATNATRRLETELTKSRQDVAAKTHLIAQLEERNKQYETQVANQAANHREKDEEIGRACTSAERLERRLKALESDLQHRSEELAAANAQLQASTEKVQEIEKERDERSLIATSKSEEVVKLESRIATMKSDMTEKLQSGQAILEKSQATIKKHESTIASTHTAVEEGSRRLQGLQQQVEGLERQLSEKKTEVSTRDSSVASLKQKLRRTSDLHLQAARQEDRARRELIRSRRKIQALCLALQVFAKQTEDLGVALGVRSQQSIIHKAELKDLKQLLSRSEDRAAVCEQRIQIERDDAIGEMSVLLGVSDGDYRKTLGRLSVDTSSWRCGALRRPRRCLVITSSLLKGRPPVIGIPPQPFCLSLSQETTPESATPGVKDINHKLTLLSLYNDQAAVDDRCVQLLWSIWAVLEGTDIQPRDVATVACAVTSAAKRMFHLFSEGSLSDLGFWITAQIVCSLVHRGFEEMELYDILPPDHPSHQSDRPLVSAGVSRILRWHRVTTDKEDISHGLFASMESCVGRFPRSCTSFQTSIDDSPAQAFIHHAAAEGTVLVLLKLATGDCLLWHDDAIKCTLFERAFAMWIRLDRGQHGAPLCMEGPWSVDSGMSSETWMKDRFKEVRPPDSDFELSD
ncbi:MAG: hypothetical protein Q9207_003666 [Kuettlingeria erythrocarpa]